MQLHIKLGERLKASTKEEAVLPVNFKLPEIEESQKFERIYISII